MLCLFWLSVSAFAVGAKPSSVLQSWVVGINADTIGVVPLDLALYSQKKPTSGSSHPIRVVSMALWQKQYISGCAEFWKELAPLRSDNGLLVMFCCWLSSLSHCGLVSKSYSTLGFLDLLHDHDFSHSGSISGSQLWVSPCTALLVVLFVWLW